MSAFDNIFHVHQGPGVHRAQFAPPGAVSNSHDLAARIFAPPQFFQALGGRHLRRERRSDAKDPRFDHSLCGTLYQPVWERKHQPSPGAQAFAWETIALAAFTPIGPGTHAIRKRLKPFPQPPAWTDPASVLIGLPRIAGQYVLQPLINPYSFTPPNLYGPVTTTSP